jgi:hypothetical protein
VKFTVAKAVKYIVTLGAALACVSALAGAVAARRFGAGAYEASAVAAALNWIAGSLALGTVFATRNSSQRINGALLAMGSRMALPLVAVVYFTRSQHPLVASGVIGFIVVGYLFGLVVETIMTVRLVAPDAPAADNAAPGGTLQQKN